MEQEIYADLYFLINTGMNLISLMITASLLHRPVNRLRALVAASAGGLYAVLALLWGSGGILGFFADCALAFVMCAILFASRRDRFSRLLRCTAVEFFVSVLLGGTMTALYSLLNRLDLPLEALEGDGLSIWLFAALSLVAAFMTARGGRVFRSAGVSKSVRVTVRLFERELTLSALIDSGNLLRDPMSGKSVIVADRRRVLAALPPPLARALAEDNPERWLSDVRYARKIRLIPTKTASGERLLPALIPDTLEISDGKSVHAADYLIAPAALGDSACGFDAVIPLE